MPRHFRRDDDLSPDELLEVLDRAEQMKADRFAWQPLLGPRTVAVLFDKPSTRTRVSFSVGIAELGGYPLVIDGAATQLGRGEPIADTARVLDRQVAAIVWRTFGQDRVDEMAAASAVPVINALTDQFHPCQVLADLQTIRAHKQRLAGVSLAYLGDTANNMAHSYLLGGAAAGLDLRLAGPADRGPDPQVLADARRLAAETGGQIRLTDDPDEALDGAEAIATDTWHSMGQSGPSDAPAGAEPLARYAVDGASLKRAAPDVVVLHCLPAYRGREISADVLEGSHSVVWDEAENRLHAQKALLSWLLERS